MTEQTAPVHLRLLSGDLLVIHPKPSDDWTLLAFHALPEAERPAYPGKIRLLETEPPTLWVDPPERRMYMDLLGMVRDIETDDIYARGSVLLEEDGVPVYEEDFYYRYDPLGPQPDILYRGRMIHFTRNWWWQEGDTIEIPPEIQPVRLEDFLPARWSEHQEEWEEKMAEFGREFVPGYQDNQEQEHQDQEEDQE